MGNQIFIHITLALAVGGGRELLEYLVPTLLEDPSRNRVSITFPCFKIGDPHRIQNLLRKGIAGRARFRVALFPIDLLAHFVTVAPRPTVTDRKALHVQQSLSAAGIASSPVESPILLLHTTTRARHVKKNVFEPPSLHKGRYRPQTRTAAQAKRVQCPKSEFHYVDARSVGTGHLR